jgi:TatD DNase family protein
MDEVTGLCDEPEIVALGETGLDFHYDRSPRREQTESFEAHLDLAARTGLPVVVHSRSADAETAELIRRHAGRVGGVLHCFSGGAALLRAGLDAGWYVSFSGIVTFRSWADAELVRRVPADRLLIETDSPYLAPVPRRGRRNEPALVAHTCAAVAEIRGEAVEAVAEATCGNARALYAIGDPA